MKNSTTLRDMMGKNTISVPDYQRAYSWDTEKDEKKPQKQVNMFISDLENYSNSSAESKYYFGHFLFEKISNKEFNVIDGQQRLTTAIIFLAVLFRQLENIRELNEDENNTYKDIINEDNQYRFKTVNYDELNFKDYVIDNDKSGTEEIKTESFRRIISARDYFKKILEEKKEADLTKILDILCNSHCTTHIVTNESDAIQMFIFQNDRGKNPTSLEIIKAQFMFSIHLHTKGNDKKELINDIKNRFSEIYKSISKFKYRISEDEILNHALRVYSKSLLQSNVLGYVKDNLSKNRPICFVKSFSKNIQQSFQYLVIFFDKDKEEYPEVDSFVSLGGIGIALPFIIKAKAYESNIGEKELRKLCQHFESLLVRHKLIGTRANINTRLNSVFEEFTKDNISVQQIIDKIDQMKKTDDWWEGYWNNQALESSIKGEINHSIAKYLLWKYENELEKENNKGYHKGYRFMRYNDIKSLIWSI